MAVVMAVVLSCVGTASASSFRGLVSATLLARDQPESNVAPTVLGCDDFTKTSNTGGDLNGRFVQVGANCGPFTQWKVDAGNWRINQGLADPGGGFALVSMPLPQTNMSVQATMMNASGGSRIGGVTASVSNNGSTYLVGTISGPGQVQLRIVVNNAATTLATVNSVAISTNAVLRLTRNGTAVSFRVDGVLVLSYALTTAQSTTLSTGLRAGMFWDRGNPVRFSDFVATTPSP